MISRSVKEFINALAEKQVYFDPLFGNHGDRLISLSARLLLHEAGVQLCEKISDADMILINGGGGMADGWPGQEILTTYSAKYPQIPLCVLPSSFLFRQKPLAGLFANRSAPVWLWAREEPSLDQLKAARFSGPVHLGCDHDLAFNFDRHDLFSPLRSIQPRQQILMVERDDWEGPTGRQRPLSIPGFNFIPEQVRNAVRKKLIGPLRKRQDNQSDFRRACTTMIEHEFPQAKSWTPICADISLAESNSFDQFLRIIAESSLVITTRLHVAILGYLLGRETCLVEGSYHKAKGVFDYSMQSKQSHLFHWTNDKQLINSDQIANKEREDSGHGY